MRARHNQRAMWRSSRPPGHVHPRSDAGDAFIKDPCGGRARARSSDDLAESLAEQFVGAVTAAQSDGLDDMVVPEELGGPFLTTSAGVEFAKGVDASNPMDAEPEPFPSATVGLVGEVSEEDIEPEQRK